MLKNDTNPQINSNNILEYYQLNQEFGIFNEYFSSIQQEPLLYVNLLKGNHNIPFDRSSIERCISLHLDTYIKDYKYDLSQIRTNSLYNIFYHTERVLNDEDKAYQFIINAANSRNQQLFILLGSLDINNFKDIENKNEAFIKKDERFGFSPKNTDKFIFSEKESLFHDNDRLKNIIKLLCGDVKIYDDQDFEKCQYMHSVKKFDDIEDEWMDDCDVYRLVLDNQTYAARIMTIDSMSMDDFHKIFHSIKTLNHNPHKNILKTHGVFFGNRKYRPCIIQDYYELNLKDGIEKNKISNVDKIKIIYQIAKVLKHFHSIDAIQSPLRPTHVLLDKDKVVKIGGFSITYSNESRAVRTNYDYIPPELFHTYKFDEKSDVYSFGCIVLFILSGSLQKIKIHDKIRGKMPEIPSTLSDFARNFIRTCIDSNPEDRPTMDTIIDDLAQSHCNLLDLEKSEISEIEKFIKNYKEK